MKTIQLITFLIYCPFVAAMDFTVLHTNLESLYNQFVALQTGLTAIKQESLPPIQRIGIPVTWLGRTSLAKDLLPKLVQLINPLLLAGKQIGLGKFLKIDEIAPSNTILAAWIIDSADWKDNLKLFEVEAKEIKDALQKVPINHKIIIILRNTNTDPEFDEHKQHFEKLFAPVPTVYMVLFSGDEIVSSEKNKEQINKLVELFK